MTGISSDEGAVETADGHVEDGDVYYYGDTAVSSKSSRTSLYIIAFYLFDHREITINDTCSIEPLSEFVQSEAGNATDYIISFESLLESIYVSNNGNYNASMFHDFFNSLNSQTQPLIDLCVTSSASLTGGSLANLLLLLSICFVSIVLV